MVTVGPGQKITASEQTEAGLTKGSTKMMFVKALIPGNLGLNQQGTRTTANYIQLQYKTSFSNRATSICLQGNSINQFPTLTGLCHRFQLSATLLAKIQSFLLRSWWFVSSYFHNRLSHPSRVSEGRAVASWLLKLMIA